MADLTNVDLNFIARQVETVITSQREQAKLQQEQSREIADMRRLLLGLVDQGYRFERRFSGIEQRLNDLVPELDLMLKSETMGRFANLETRLDEKLARMRDELIGMIGEDGPPAP